MLAPRPPTRFSRCIARTADSPMIGRAGGRPCPGPNEHSVPGLSREVVVKVVQEVRSAYVRGRLVPFLGSGMSRPVCRTWLGMIEALEKVAGDFSGTAARGPRSRPTDLDPAQEKVADECSGTAANGPRCGSTALDHGRRAAQALERLRLGCGEATAD